MPAVAGAAVKPRRDYIRIPEEMSVQLQLLSARYDVPVRSLTRVLLCIGLEALHVDEPTVQRIVEQMANPALSVCAASD